MPATVARSACWLSLDLSWLGSSSSIDMKLLLSVQSKRFPSMANKARGTKVSSCCQLASFKFNYGRERATIVIRHIVKVILHFYNLVGELVLHWFPSTFPGFRFPFLHSCPEIDFCHDDSFIIKSCVFLLVNLILAAYVFFTCGSMTTFVMMLDVLHWLPTEQRISYRIASLVWRCLVGLAPVYLRELCCPPLGAMSSRSLRSSQQGLLLVPFAMTSTEQIHAFSVVGLSTWNGLPSELRIFNRTTSPAFFSHLKTALFDRAGVGRAYE